MQVFMSIVIIIFHILLYLFDPTGFYNPNKDINVMHTDLCICKHWEHCKHWKQGKHCSAFFYINLINLRTFNILQVVCNNSFGLKYSSAASTPIFKNLKRLLFIIWLRSMYQDLSKLNKSIMWSRIWVVIVHNRRRKQKNKNTLLALD